MINFRSVEFWKAAITILPDTAFFELLRTVFGKIKTPFNKQILIDELEKFLSHNDIQRNIASYIDENDRRVIAAIAALDEPAPGELEAFFCGDLGFAELHDIIVNLEERFIVYRFLDKDQKQPVSRLALNPVLKTILSPLARDSSRLFPSVPAGDFPSGDIPSETETKTGALLCDDRILSALLSFVIQNPAFFKYGGGIRQKLINTAKALFPGLPLETVMGGLQVLGLFFAKDEMLFPDYRRFTAFGRLSRRERMEYFTAAIVCYEYSGLDGGLSSWLLRARVNRLAAAIHRFFGLLDSERLYPHTTLRKLACIPNDVKNQQNAAMPPGADWIDEPPRRGPVDSPVKARGNAAKGGTDSPKPENDVNNYEKIIDIMKRTGMLVPVSAEYWRTASPGKNPLPDAAVIAMDTPFTFLMYPEIAYNDAITLASVSGVVEAGPAVRFELNRDAVVAAFDRGMTAAEIIELTRRLSHNRIDENLIYSLNDWEKRHSEVTLRRGVVLTLSPEQRHLTETRQLKRLLTETLAPGVYMLPEASEEPLVEALHKAGVTIIARRRESRAGNNIANNDEAGPLRNFFPALHGEPVHPPPPLPLNSGDTTSSNFSSLNFSSPDIDAASAAALTDGFHSILKQMCLSGEERDELAARIDRRLVLCDSQLKDAVVRYEKLTARGLDYVGKALIAKQAVSLRSPVELVWPGKQKPQRVFGIPKALEKSGNESFLVIEPSGSEDTIKVSLGKISFLRRIKKSIFEN